jgi:transposase-like protein
MKIPKTLSEAIKFYSDPDNCIEVVKEMRWLDGQPVCPYCDAKRNYWIKTQRRWKCAECRKQFSVKVGTIFEDSPIGLDKWLTATWLLANSKNGVSSHEIARSLGVTQKTAWFLLHRIRFALMEDHKSTVGSHWGNPIEVDETHVGGKFKNMHAKRRNALKLAEQGYAKTPVMGMLNRETRKVRVKVIPNIKRETLQAEILKNIGFNAHVFTDQSLGYDGLDKNVKNFTHRTVNHMYEYVKGRVHTNGIENFWSLLKRGLNGTYVAVEPFHLDAYVSEQVFRFNNRATKDNPLTDADRFVLALLQISGKRLTYRELTGKEGETSSGDSAVVES